MDLPPSRRRPLFSTPSPFFDSVPFLAIRWPGVIKPGTVNNEVFAHEDMLPTLLAAAGVPDVKEKLLKGLKIGDKTFKVHLDGYNITDALAGKTASPRHEFFYYAEFQMMRDFHAGRVARRREGPHDDHAFGPFREVLEAQFHRVGIGLVGGDPGKRSAPAECAHLHDVARILQ